ncbi:hypothetical protein ABX014_09140 [Snodgrassella alvi]|uniref:hypothetical protein n=1 Tax=Snodgrassella alvi TaxID=1196083 RepID=UPI0034615EFB
MHTSFQYDRTSRLTSKQTKRPGAGILPDIILDRSYSYDNLDRLAGKKHNRQGQSDYRYDVTGRIESCCNEAYWETLQYDAAANLLDRRCGEEESNQNLIHFNQLLSSRGLKTATTNTDVPAANKPLVVPSITITMPNTA